MAGTPNRIEYLSINSTPSSTAGWQFDLLPLRVKTRRGDNLLLPLASGRRAVDLETDEIDVVLPGVIFGGFDRDGAAHTVPIIGVDTNFDYLVAQWMGASSYTATWHKRSGATPTATVQVVDLRVGNNPEGLFDVPAAARIRIPAGAFA